MNEQPSPARRDLPPQRAEVLGTSQKSLPDLAADIQTAHADVARAFGSGIASAIRAGKALREAKRQCRHGEWEDFVASHCHISMRMAARYMQLARHEDRIGQMLEGKSPNVTGTRVSISQRSALKLLTTKKRKRRPRRLPPASNSAQ